MKKKHSLATVAAELGVSKAAVSLALSGKGRKTGLSLDLERRIVDHCRQINYQPNIHAQRMNSTCVSNIGILLDESVNTGHISPFEEYNTSLIVGGIAAAADEAGYRFSVQLFRPEMNDDKVFDWFRNREIDGLIYYGFVMPQHWLKIFAKENRRVVGVSIEPSPDIPTVNIDNFGASYDLTEYLLEKGRREFLYFGGNQESYPGTQRYLGFCQALVDHGVVFCEENFICGDFSETRAYDLIKNNLSNDRIGAIDGIVCANDEMAIGVISALKEAGIVVSGQIAVVGADNIPAGRSLSPSLTTFDYVPFEQGRTAFRLLHDMIGGSSKPATVKLQAKLYSRNSG
jgi:DNA-binding LacI/PurR family transcriptional regulator